MSRRNPAYDQARERDGWRCQFPIETDKRGDTWRKCGRNATEAHHRRRRSQGGGETLENLICLCNQHHHWVHHNIAEAREMGLLVMQGDDPARHYWMDAASPERDEDFWMDEDQVYDEAKKPGPPPL